MKNENENNPPKQGWLFGLAAICNSQLAQGMGLALIILAVLLGMGGCAYLVGKGVAAREANRHEIEAAPKER